MIKLLYQQKIKKSKVKTQNATKNIDCTTIVDRLKTVRWSSDSHQTGVFEAIYVIKI